MENIFKMFFFKCNFNRICIFNAQSANFGLFLRLFKEIWGKINKNWRKNTIFAQLSAAITNQMVGHFKLALHNKLFLGSISKRLNRYLKTV